MTVKVQIKTNKGVNRTIEIKDSTATDNNIIAFAGSYTSLLDNNDTIKTADKIVTTPLTVA